MPLEDAVRELATGKNLAAFTTLFADGTPQTQLMWVDADEDHILINTEVHRTKFTNIQHDPRVTVTIWPAGDPYRYVEVRGRVTETIQGPEALTHIHACSRRYFDRDYPTEQITSERVILRITPDRVLRRNV